MNKKGNQTVNMKNFTTDQKKNSPQVIYREMNPFIYIVLITTHVILHCDFIFEEDDLE